MKAPAALFTSFGLQNLFIHGILCTNKVDYLILWLITCTYSYVMVTLVAITQNKFRWPMAAGYLTDTRFEFFKIVICSCLVVGPVATPMGTVSPAAIWPYTLHLWRLPSTNITHKR